MIMLMMNEKVIYLNFLFISIWFCCPFLLYSTLSSVHVCMNYENLYFILVLIAPPHAAFNNIFYVTQLYLR